MSKSKSRNKFLHLSKADKMRLVGSLYVPREVDRQLEACFEQVRHRGKLLDSPAGLFLTGVGGVGKTALLKNYAAGFEPKFDEGMIERPVVYFQVPVVESLSALLSAFCSAIEMPILNRMPIQQRIDSLHQQIQAQGVQLIIVDEVQNLLAGYRSLIKKKVDFLKYLSRRSGVPFVLSGLPHARALLEHDEQFAQMFSVMNLKNFSAPGGKDFLDCRRWLRDIDNELPFDEYLRIADPDIARRIVVATQGNPALIMRLIQAISFAVIEDGRKTPNTSDFEEAFEVVGLDAPEALRPKRIDARCVPQRSARRADAPHVRNAEIVTLPVSVSEAGNQRPGIGARLARWFKTQGRKSA